jgi:hypothetical protein
MTGRNEVPIALEIVLAPGWRHPKRPETEETDARLDVAVVFTSADATITALRKAGALASQLTARVILVVPQVVPYPLPLDSPPVLIDFNERRFRAIASESPIETVVRVYLCRDRMETLATVLKPQSLVVLGGRKRWWPTNEERLARKLRRAGHEVIFTETEQAQRRTSW